MCLSRSSTTAIIIKITNQTERPLPKRDCAWWNRIRLHQGLPTKETLKKLVFSCLSLSLPRVIDRDSRTNSCVRVCVCTQLSSGGIFIYPLPLSLSLFLGFRKNINLLLLSVIERREGERKKKGLRNYQQRWLLLLGRDFFLSFFLSCMWKQVSGHVLVPPPASAWLCVT